MSECEFNLLDEKWIRVLNADGNVEDAGLLEFFNNAHRYISLAGDSPTQNISLLRLLLAILYAVHMRQDIDGVESYPLTDDEAISRWLDIWDSGSFDSNLFRDYLEMYRDHFYFIHPTNPFYQTPVRKGTDYPISKFIGNLFESGNKPRLFSSYNNGPRNSVDYPTAARWLIHLIGFDDTAAKPSESGLPSPGKGWLGKIGPIFVEGRNLFETLMLNFVMVDDNGEPFPDGKAPWELDYPRTEERVPIPAPLSPIEILTLQSRRIYLGHEGGYIVECRILGGDIVSEENCLVEQMTLWRNREDVWVPKLLDPSKSLWRDYSSILVKSLEGEKIRRPGVVNWACRLFDQYDIIPYEQISISVAGVSYGRDISSTVLDFIDDGIIVNKRMLSEIGTGMNVRVESAISSTDKCIYYLGILENEILLSEGYDKEQLKGRMSHAKTQCFYSMDAPFTRWLASIDPSLEMDDIDYPEKKIMEWLSIVEKMVLHHGRMLVDNCNSRAFVGINDDKESKTNVFTAFDSFRKKIYSITRK